MGLLSRMLGGTPGESAITETIGDAVRVLPGVTAHSLTFRHQQGASGTVSGVVDVATATTLLDVLRTVHQVLAGLLGDSAHGVTHDVSARTPDGTTTTLGELGLSQPTSGREIVQRLL